MGSFFNGGSRSKPRYERLPLDTFHSMDSTRVTKLEDASEDNLLFDMGDLGQNGRLLPQSTTANGYDSDEEIEFYKDSRRMPERTGQCCGMSRRWLVCLLVVLVIVVIFFCAVYFVGPGIPFLKGSKSKKGWTSKTYEYATEAALRLYDVNLDGVQDVILGGAATSSLDDIRDEPDFCKSINVEYPCAGVVVAFDGRNGAMLWTIRTRVDVFAVQCGKLDINEDGHKDCIIAGRMGTMQGIDPINGVSLWEVDPTVTDDNFNFYEGQVVPDLDQDGVEDFVVTHGGDTRFSEKELDRPAGRLILLSGKTGKSLGRYLDMRDGHETYSSITLYERQNGAVYLLFGSGGETISGSLWMISLRDLYCYVTTTEPCDASHLSHVPDLQSAGYDEPWGSPIRALPSGAMEIIRSKSTKGVTIPTELVDMNNDGVDDLIVFMYNSTILVLNGVNLEVMWSTGNRFSQYETYSNPAPGYFNDDDTLDLMVRLSLGKWPNFQSTNVYVLDGRNGEILWTLKIANNQALMSSPITLQSHGHKDAFLFWVQGRQGNWSAAGQEEREPAGHGMGPEDDMNDEDSVASTIPPRRRRRHGQEDVQRHPCLMNMYDLHGELLLIDRDLARNPLRLATIKASKYKYTLTDKDRQSLKSHSPHHPEPAGMGTASPDLFIPSHAALPSPAGGAPEAVTQEDLARHDLRRHTTTATIPEAPPTPEEEEVTTAAVTMPEEKEPTPVAATTPGGKEPTPVAFTTLGGKEKVTDAAPVPGGQGSTVKTRTPKISQATDRREETSTAAFETTLPSTTSTPEISKTSGMSERKRTVLFETASPLTTGSTETLSLQPTHDYLATASDKQFTSPLDALSGTTPVAKTDVTLETTPEPEVTSTIEDTSEIVTEETASMMELETTMENLQTTYEKSDDLSPTTHHATATPPVDGKMNTSTPIPKNKTSDVTGSPSTHNSQATTTTHNKLDTSKEPLHTSGTRASTSSLSTTGATQTQSVVSKGQGTMPPLERTEEKQDNSSVELKTLTDPDNQSTTPQRNDSSEPSNQTQSENLTRGPEKGKVGDRQKRETAGGDMCTVFIPVIFGTGVVGDLDSDGNLDFIYAESRMAQLMDENFSYIRDKVSLVVHRLSINDAIKREDWIKLGEDQVTLRDGIRVTPVDSDEVDQHFHFLPASSQSWTSYMGKNVDGRFKKNGR